MERCVGLRRAWGESGWQVQQEAAQETWLDVWMKCHRKSKSQPHPEGFADQSIGLAYVLI